MKVRAPNIHPFAATGHFSLYYRPFFSLSSYRKTGKYLSKRGCRGGLGACQSFVNMKVHAPNIHPFAANGHFSLYYRPFFSLSSYK